MWVRHCLDTQIERHYVEKIDKGNGICVDSKDTYIRKMNKLLDDASKFKRYKVDKRVKKDSFIFYEEKFNRQGSV